MSSSLQDDTDYEKIPSPDTSTKENSPTSASFSVDDLAAAILKLKLSAASPESLWSDVRLQPLLGKPLSGASWFEIRLLFCRAEIKNNAYHYNPQENRKKASQKVTIIFHLDRTESAAQNRKRLWGQINFSTPRLNGDECEESAAAEIGAFAVASNELEESEPGMMVTSASVIAQLWEMETSGLLPMKPNLFGMAGNELQVMLVKDLDLDYEDSEDI